MENNIKPVIAFSAFSGTGKTTIIEQLIAFLKSRGYKIAAIKHDAHDFEIDKEGKDSWRFTKAGADVTIISSKEKTALITKRSLELSELLSMAGEADLIIVEGFNNEPLPRIGISRKETGKGLRLPPDSYIAVMTDEEINIPVPVFALDDIGGIAGFIIDNIIN